MRSAPSLRSTGAPAPAPAPSEPHSAERWILSRTEATAAEATRLLDQYLFGEYVSLLQQFVWGELADVYVELAKPGLRDDARRAGVVRTLAYVLDRTLRLLHPVMPFITETLALQLWRGHERRDPAPSLVLSRWPEPAARDEALEARFAVAVEVGRAIRNLRQDAGVEPGAKVRVALANADALRWAAPHIASLTNAEVTFGPGDGAATVVGTTEVRLSVLRDPADERARLEKELAIARAELARSRELLGKPGFADRAPAPVVEKERARLAEREERAAMLDDELRRLG